MDFTYLNSRVQFNCRKVRLAFLSVSQCFLLECFANVFDSEFYYWFDLLEIFVAWINTLAKNLDIVEFDCHLNQNNESFVGIHESVPKINIQLRLLHSPKWKITNLKSWPVFSLSISFIIIYDQSFENLLSPSSVAVAFTMWVYDPLAMWFTNTIKDQKMLDKTGFWDVTRIFLCAP